MILVKTQCFHCKLLFETTKGHINKNNKLGLKIYCSKICNNENKKKRHVINCLSCNKEFESRITENRKYCSSSCNAKSNNKNRKQFSNCLFCGNQTYNRKYCNNKCQVDFNSSEKIKSGNASSRILKSFLLKKYGHSCWKCKNKTWNEEPIPLELEHKDGNSENNTFDNLEILCCNCHAQTSTYKARNKGKGRHSRRERYKEGKSY
jgi:hypothetical protein